MASKVSGIIEQINIDGGDTQAIASTAYGYCTTPAGTPIKNVDMTGFYLQEGVTIHVKFEHENTATEKTPQLKFNNESDDNAKPIVQYGSIAAGTDAETNGWHAGAVLTLTYDGTSWVRDQGYNTDTIIQHIAFTINSGTHGVKLTSTAFTNTSEVLEIVVTGNASNLKDFISWESASGYINLTTNTPPDANIIGYILVSRGNSVTVTPSDITS